MRSDMQEGGVTGRGRGREREAEGEGEAEGEADIKNTDRDRVTQESVHSIVNSVVYDENVRKPEGNS